MVFCKKGVLKNFAKCTGEQLYKSLFFNKFTDLRPATVLKRDCRRYFPEIFAKFLRTPFFIEHLRWLLLHRQNLPSHGVIHDHIFFMERELIRLSQQKSCSKYPKYLIALLLTHSYNIVTLVVMFLSIFVKNKTEDNHSSAIL